MIGVFFNSYVEAKTFVLPPLFCNNCFSHIVVFWAESYLFIYLFIPQSLANIVVM